MGHAVSCFCVCVFENPVVGAMTDRKRSRGLAPYLHPFDRALLRPAFPPSKGMHAYFTTIALCIRHRIEGHPSGKRQKASQSHTPKPAPSSSSHRLCQSFCHFFQRKHNTLLPPRARRHRHGGRDGQLAAVRHACAAATSLLFHAGGVGCVLSLQWLDHRFDNAVGLASPVSMHVVVWWC